MSMNRNLKSLVEATEAKQPRHLRPHVSKLFDLIAKGVPDEELKGKGRDFYGINFTYANFQSAELSQANFQYANFEHAILKEANLRYADLDGADLRNAKNLDKVKWPKGYRLVKE